MVVLISQVLLALHMLFMTPSFFFKRDSSVHQVAEGFVLTCLQALTKVVVKASQKPELLLFISVGVVLGIAHHLHEVPLILLDPHGTLVHGAELLSLLDHQLLR